MKTPLEIEIKLRVESAASARAMLRRGGFAVIAPRVFEQNLVLDDERESLRAKNMLLRVRSAAKLFTCTFKGPEIPGRHKRRQEIEFTFGEWDSCLALFAALGYPVSCRYEKYRTEFARANEAGHAMLDETPIGVFMELEGPAQWIDRTAKLLGFAKKDYVTASYRRLYESWCEEKSIKPQDMRF